MKCLKELAKLMTNGEILQYNEEGKTMFRRIGTKAMKELALLLELREHNISFNPGGIAVSGDLMLMGMWTEHLGVYISMNKDFPNAPWGQVLYRTIKHMKDYTGGSNNWLKFELLGNPQELKNTIMRLKN
jgi:hypothetical protein